MNRFKRICILLVVLAVVCMATLALTRYEEKQEKIKSSGEIILEIPKDSVTALSWEYEDEKTALSFHRGEEKWLYDEDDAFPVSEDKILSILSHFEAFGAAFIIEDVEDYSQYGLDDPECTIHLTAGEETHSIRLGDFSRMDEQRYVDIGDGNVYLVKEDPMDYVDPALSSMILNDDAPGFETVEDIAFTGKENYTIACMEDSPDAYSSADIFFTTHGGRNVPLDTTSVRRYLNTVTSLDLSAYTTYNATEEELKTYGLDTPELSASIRYIETNDGTQTEKEFTLHISQNPAELAAAEEAEAIGEVPGSVTKYVRIGDSQIVYELDDVDYGILSGAAYDDLRHKEVIWAEWDSMTQVDIALEGERYTLSSTIGQDGQTRLWYYGAAPAAAAEDPANESQPAEAATEDPSPEELDMTAFQTALKGMYADSFTEEAPSGRQEISLTVYLDNENHPEVEITLYRYDGTHCLAVVDGESVSLIPRANVVDLIEAVHAIVL